MPQLFTIGHSTHPLAEFLSLLARHGVRALADVRRFPGSRKFPQFNQAELAATLNQAGIEYHWLQELGGRRQTKSVAPSRNTGLRNESFRSYADYMTTNDFRAGIAELLALAERLPTAFMCSESLFWRCHRRLISDYLLAGGFTARHIMPGGELRPHALTEGAQVENGAVTYPPGPGDQAELPFY